MALLTTSELLTHLDSDLATAALQRLLDDAEAEIIKRFGAHSAGSSQVETLVGTGLEVVFVNKPISAVNSVIETIGTTATTLAADDYSVHNKFVLERLADGTNSRSTWGDRVKVTYQPVSDTDQRKVVQIQLCKLAVNFEGLKSEKAGNYSRTWGEYNAERKQILNSLQHGFGYMQ